MTDEELAAEHKALLSEQAQLDEEFRRLRGQTHDVEGHKRLANDLRLHVQRLHGYVAALHARYERLSRT